MQQLGHASQESINFLREESNFLREEFRQPVNVRDLVWDTPRGMEDQAYTVSLIAMELDEQKEAE